MQVPIVALPAYLHVDDGDGNETVRMTPDQYRLWKERRALGASHD